MGEPSDISEQVLVLRSQIGDEAAFEELLRAYGPRLLQFTHKLMQTSRETAEDLNQDIWVAIYRGLPGLLDVTKFRQWAFRIARDRVYREFRRRRLPVQPLCDTAPALLCEAQEDSAVDLEELDRTLDAISPEHREALVLRFLEEMSYEEIAQITGATVGTVRSRIHYAKTSLRKAWTRKNI